MKDKIIALKKELGGVRRHRDFQRRSRKKLGLPVVALVGYTNAGKSTLLNTLTRAGVMAENMLFATLDPTTRKVKLSGLKVRPRVCVCVCVCVCACCSFFCCVDPAIWLTEEQANSVFCVSLAVLWSLTFVRRARGALDGVLCGCVSWR